jgi:hypothetical protein
MNLDDLKRIKILRLYGQRRRARLRDERSPEFLSRGDYVDGLLLKVMVPVSARSAASDHGNMVLMMTADLPVGKRSRAASRFVRSAWRGHESKQAVGWTSRAVEYALPTVLARPAAQLPRSSEW